MRREQIVRTTSAQWIDDEHMGCRRVMLGFLIHHGFCATRNLAERRGKPKWIATDFCTAPVSGIFAGTAYGHLHNHSGKWRNDHRKDRADHAHDAIAVFAVTT